MPHGSYGPEIDLQMIHVTCQLQVGEPSMSRRSINYDLSQWEAGV